jgi:parvulin-like peptidyl-prolyl isomerase
MKKRNLILLLVILTIVLSGCTQPTAAPTTPPTLAPTQTQTAPTPTSAPLALRVNGEGILLSDYDAEMTRLQQALTELGQELTPEEQKDKVITNFVDELLLSQAAAQAGYSVTDEQLQERIDKLSTDMGGTDKLTEWETKYGYTTESFTATLKRQVLAGWQRDQIINSVPETMEQVHARQLFYQDEANAVDALNKLEDGVDFERLAELQDPTLKGDLGWFPRGILFHPEVEEAVFSLKAGETSGIVHSSIGYHILNVIEIDPQHPLSVEARRILQEAKLTEWLDASRAVSTIEILVP